MIELPRWLGARRAGVLALIALTGAAGVYAYQSYVRKRFLQEYVDTMPVSASLSADDVHDWLAARLAETTVLADLVAFESEARGNLSAAADAPLLGLVSRQAFASGAVYEPSGRRVASAAKTRLDAGSAVDKTPESPPPLTMPADTASVTANQDADSNSVVDFTAPVRLGGRTLGYVVLRATTNGSVFAHLNQASPTDRTQRTTVLARKSDGALVVARAGSFRPDRDVLHRYTKAQLPDRIWTSMQGVPDQGIGIGLSGSTVVHVEAPILGTHWLLVRERDVTELMEMLDRPLMVNDIFLSLFVLLVMGVVTAVWRTAHLLRENDKARLRGNFVSSVSHELRTPLTQIRMYAEMLRSGLLREPAESERALRVIEKEASRLSLLVDRTLDFTRSKEALRVEPVPPTDVGEAVRAAAAAFEPLAAERRAVLKIDVPDGVHARIEAAELQQVLLNLLDNAVKYGPRGQTIGVTAREDGTVTRISVEDEGPGVPVAERDAIFGAFARGKAARGSRESGSGIGLSVVRNLVEQFGGRAYVEARRNGGGEAVAGARFVIELRSPLSG